MGGPIFTEQVNAVAEPKRIRIDSFASVKRQMGELGFAGLADFFVAYESKNQQISSDEVHRRMRQVLLAMRESVKRGLERPNFTRSGMIQGGAAHMRDFAAEGRSLLGPQFSRVVQNTMAVAENNACMGRIVAAPTAGSSGVLPGALLTVSDLYDFPEEKTLNALFVAGGIGELIALQASLSGATHGCQAENGAASAMAAAGIVALFDGDLDAVESAAAFALKNLMGLVCDPVAGLVEVPCVKRNVAASVNAVACAEMAMAGIRTVIPLDEVILTMRAVGKSLPDALRETSLGGLAATPAAIAITRRVRES